MFQRICLALLVMALLPRLVQATPLLVDSEWLASNLGSPHIAIVDMSDSMQYSRFHIPGARHLPYDAINQANRQQVSLSVGSERLIQILGQLGISADMHIVIYDDIGGLNGSRLFWELERIGHRKVSLLDGGLVNWILAGKKVVATHAQYTKTTYSPARTGGQYNLAEFGDIASDSQGKAILLDVRSKEEYTGHPRQKRSGHVPGAHWWHWEDNVNFDNNFKLQEEKTLLQRANTVGLSDKKQPVIVYCRSGHRAAQSYFTLRRLGFENVRLYDGSMAEYSLSGRHEIRQGEQP